MKFTISDITQLHDAIHRVSQMAPRRYLVDEITIKVTEGNELVVYRSSESRFALVQPEVDLSVEQAGVVTVSNAYRANPLRFLDGPHVVEVEGNDLVFRKAIQTSGYVSLRISDTEPEEPLVPPVHIKTPFPDNTNPVLWAKGKDDMDNVFIWGNKICCANNGGTHAALIYATDNLSDDHVVFNSDILAKLPSENVKFATDGRYIWFSGSDFYLRSTVVEKGNVCEVFDRIRESSIRSGYLESYILSLSHEIQIIYALSGIARLEVVDNTLKLSALRNQMGRSERFLSIQKSEDTSFVFRPQEFMSALKMISGVSDKVVICNNDLPSRNAEYTTGVITLSDPDSKIVAFISRIVE